jgi:hypothetical protein
MPSTLPYWMGYGTKILVSNTSGLVLLKSEATFILMKA